MKVAFATTDGKTVDEHFGRSGMFAVYEITPEGFIYLEMRKFSEEGRDTAVEESRGEEAQHESVMRQKVEALADCKLVYFTNIGGPSAARLVNKGMMPMKVKEPEPIEESLQKLLEAVKNSPPPWLKRALAEKEQSADQE